MKGNGHGPANDDRLPPHSPESEQGVLGCIMLSPKECLAVCADKLRFRSEAFYDLRHQTIYNEMVEMNSRRQSIDVITLQQSLKDRQLLEQIGGIVYLSSLPGVVPSSANISYYLDIVFEKWLLRRMIRTCTDAVGRIYDFEGDAYQLVSDTRNDFARLITQQSNTQQRWSVSDLIRYDPANDPNAIIGIHDGVTTRYLCKGSGAWIIGQSGLGKSSLGIQQGFTWALGRPFFGVSPVKPLRVLIVQNENDQGDCSEATQGVCAAICKDDDDMAAVEERVRIIRCRGKTGKEFCFWLEQEVFEWKADLVYVDPMLRYAGIDVSRQDQCTRFLNDQLDPVLASTNVVLIGAHHTGKPKSARETAGWTIYDHAYSGIGSSELVNWARAITILRVLNEADGTFDLMLAKRGSRAWATHPNGDFTTTLYLRHSKSGICWEQVDPNEMPQREEKRASEGRPSKITQIASMNLHAFCAACTKEGEGLRTISQRLENFLALQHIDASRCTCNRAIAALVANQKLKKTESATYVIGSNA